MTDTAKTTLWVIIILVLVGGIWWFIGANPDQENSSATQTSEQVSDAQVSTTTPAEMPAQDASTSISIQDKTDATIDADLNKIDEQLKILNTNSAN